MPVSSLRPEQPLSPPNYDSPYLSITELADYLGVAPRTVLYWVSAGEILTLELPGRIRRFDRVAIDEWVRSRAVPARTEGRRR